MLGGLFAMAAKKTQTNSFLSWSDSTYFFTVSNKSLRNWCNACNEFSCERTKKIRAFADSWAIRGPGRWHQGLNWITTLLTEIARLEEKRGILPPMPVFSYSAKWSEEWDDADKDSDKRAEKNCHEGNNTWRKFRLFCIFRILPCSFQIISERTFGSASRRLKQNCDWWRIPIRMRPLQGIGPPEFWRLRWVAWSLMLKGFAMILHAASPCGCSDDVFRGTRNYGSWEPSFSGSIVPSAYYEKDKGVCSIMVEIRRDLIMDELTGARKESAAEVFGLFPAFARRLIEIRPENFF